MGNKSDCDYSRVVCTERGQQLASSLGITFREISAKRNKRSVDEVCMYMRDSICEFDVGKPLFTMRVGV